MAGTITVNDDPMPWREGMTVSDLIRERNFKFPLVVVMIDGVHVPRDRFDVALIPDGAVVSVIHLIGGG